MSDKLVIQHQGLTVSIDAPAHLKDEAYTAVALIGQVTNREERDRAVAAHTKSVTLRKLVEVSRKEVKDPYWDMGQKIDAAARDFVADLLEEETRVAGLISVFESIEMANLKAQEALRCQDLNALERRWQEERSTATTQDQLDEIDYRYNNEARELKTPLRLELAPGQTLKEDWVIQPVDMLALARAYPQCVKIELRVEPTKKLLDAGATLPGINATRVLISGVRVTKQKTLLLTA